MKEYLLGTDVCVDHQVLIESLCNILGRKKISCIVLKCDGELLRDEKLLEVDVKE